MSKPKKLDLNFNQLAKIAESLNRNREANKNRHKEDRIDTDTFLRKKFKIDRRDYSFSIKGTGIVYNPRTYLYEIPIHKSNTKIIQGRPLENSADMSNVSKVLREIASTSEGQASEKETEKYKSNTSLSKDSLDNLMPILLEMIEWYKLQKKNSVDSNNNISMELTLNDPELSGTIGSHPIRCYNTIFSDFKIVCSQYPEYKQQDLISKALLEFIKKYKK